MARERFTFDPENRRFRPKRPDASARSFGPPDFRAPRFNFGPGVPYTGIRGKRGACEKVGRKGYEAQVEFEMLTEAEAQAIGAPYALHTCLRPKSQSGGYIPVATVEDAMVAAQKYQSCVKKNGNGAAARLVCQRALFSIPEEPKKRRRGRK